MVRWRREAMSDEIVETLTTVTDKLRDHTTKMVLNYNELFEENKKLEEQIKIMREALEFYADEDSWSRTSDQQCPHMLRGEDIENEKGTKKFLGGMVAREALKKLEEMERGNENF
jgi:hypothetical protein